MLLQKFSEGMTNKDLPLLDSLLHEEMLFLQDTILETKEQWVKDMEVQFENGTFDASKIDITTKFETKDMGALEIIIKEGDTLLRLSSVFLYKDDKIYRQLVKYSS